MSYLFRLKPVQKMEGMTNGMSSGAGQQQQQQASGLSDISAQVQQYQQFLGKNISSISSEADWPSLGYYQIIRSCLDHRYSCIHTQLESAKAQSNVKEFVQLSM